MKKLIRKLVRYFTRNLPVKGRHRLVKSIGDKLGSDTELLNINGFNIEIDHKVLWSRHLYYGVYEEHLINFLKKNIKFGDVVFDPGANMGYITAISLGLVGEKGKVYSFEPSRTCYGMLAGNNDFEKFENLNVYNAALSDKKGEAFFFDTPRVVSKGYACLETVSSPSDGTKYSVPTYSIDSFCRDNQVDHIRFLKLDIEGAELLALQGAQEMMKAGKIDYILVETLMDKSNPGKTAANNEINQLLEGAGFKPFVPTRSGKLKPIDFDKVSYLRTDIIWKGKHTD